MVDENNLTCNISSLRHALAERPNEHRYIVTIPGRGYQFAAEATTGTNMVFERHARARVLFEEQSDTDTPNQRVRSRILERKFWHPIAFRLTAAAALGVLFVSAVWFYSIRRAEISPPPRVLPLTSLPGPSRMCQPVPRRE